MGAMQGAHENIVTLANVGVRIGHATRPGGETVREALPQAIVA